MGLEDFLVSFFGDLFGLFSGAFAVSFRECKIPDVFGFGKFQVKK